ncbi:MAG: hypothetical protein HZC36_00055 [Armatimonadetes bacterium]|nr:hypothetical protein [Armatimonadota bacterium]
MAKIGFVGLGVMGGPMAGHVARSGADRPGLSVRESV